MQTYKEKIKEALSNKLDRIYLCENSIFLFGLYYFGHYFFRPSASFHKEMAKDLEFKGHNFLMWIMFREAVKTVWVRIKFVHAICYKKKRNMLWISQDLKRASKNVMAISGELKGNPKIIEDFGQLFWEDKSEINKKSKSKTFSAFTSTNGVTVKGLSTQTSTRGDIEDEFRPDLIAIDDIENLKTVRSITITKGVIDFLEELFGGLSVDCDVVIPCNRLARNGSVAWLEKHLETNPKAIIHEVPLIKDGKIAWPEKYVETEKEAQKLNAKIPNSKEHYVSIEMLKYRLGTVAFEREMLLKPLDNAGSPVRLEWIKREKVPALDTMDLVIPIDPAISQKQTADYFAIAVLGRHRETGKIYVMHSYKTRCSIVEQLNLIKNYNELYSNATFRIETVAYQEALAQLVEAEIRNGIYISVETFKPSGDKVLRMQGVSPFIERGDVVFSDSSGLDELIVNTAAFPFTDDGHDDDVDTLISGVEHFVKNVAMPSLHIG